MQDECVWGARVENLVRTLIASARREYAVGRVGGSEAALPLTLAGPARRKQAELYLALLLAATRCCYVLLGAATIFHSVLLLLLGVASCGQKQS